MKNMDLQLISYVEVKKHNGKYYAYFNSGRERSEYQLDKWFDIIQNSDAEKF